MSGRNRQRKLGTARGSPRRSRTAKAPRISRQAAKSRCARAWGGWGRLSDDGPGQHNPDSSEDPWGCGASHFMAVHDRACGPGKNGDPALAAECTKGGCKPVVATCMSGADLSEAIAGKVPSERPAFQPYRGKPAVRNERGDRGNVGIIRSPLRASILPDQILHSKIHLQNVEPAAEAVYRVDDLALVDEAVVELDRADRRHRRRRRHEGGDLLGLIRIGDVVGA